MSVLTFNNWNEWLASLDDHTTFTVDTLIINGESIVDGQIQPKVETIIISNLILNNIRTTSDMFRVFNNLKALIIHNLQANMLTDTSRMFYNLKAEYVELKLNMLNVVNAESMFAHCMINKLILNINFSNRLVNANNMFNGWIGLTPNIISSLKTYNASIDNIFTGCSFEDSLLARLYENNRLANMSKEDIAVDNFMNENITRIRQLIDDLIASRLDTVIKCNHENKELMLSRINDGIRELEEHIRSITTKIDDNERKYENSMKDLTYRVNGNEFMLKESVKSQANLTSLVARFQNVIEKFDQRIYSLEQGTK